MTDVDRFVKTRMIPEHQVIAKALRALMHKHAPGAAELVTYGIPAWRGNKMLAVMNPSKTGLTLAFSRGAEFTDRHGLLSGVGTVSKHVKLKTVKDVNEKALADYIRQAVKLDTAGTKPAKRR